MITQTMAVQRRPNFLVVDNDPNDAFFIKRALSRTGSAYVCSSPKEAQAYLLGSDRFKDREKFPLPELILTDLRMNDQCGLQFVQWLRDQQQPLRDTQIVVLTGSASREDFETAQKLGAQRIVEKPSRLEDLQAVLAAVTQQFCPVTGK